MQEKTSREEFPEFFGMIPSRDPGSITSEELTQLLVVKDRIIDDVGSPVPVPIDAIYLFGQATSFSEVVIKKGEELFKKYRALGWNPKMLYCGEPATSGFSGGEEWKKKLLMNGVPLDRHIPVLGSRYEYQGSWLINTGTESLALVATLKEMGATSCVVVAPAFHLTRIYASLVRVERTLQSGIMFFARVAGPIRWDLPGVHSQGTLQGTPVDFSLEESKKTLTYANLASPNEILIWMDQRDKMVRELLTK